MERTMFIKAAITTVIAAMLAGGVVYYGMPATTGGSVSVDPIEASEPIKKKWMEKYLKTAPSTNTSPTTREDLNSSPQQVEVPATDTNENSDTPTVNIGNEATEPAEEVINETPKPDTIPAHPISDSARAKLQVAAAQADLINRAELKDQAVMDLIDFALANNLFSEAETSVASIVQAELRDTARSRIANTYALQGHSDAAFRMIEQVEVEALQDVMRLQAIQALIAPQRLPQPMQ